MFRLNRMQSTVGISAAGALCVFLGCTTTINGKRVGGGSPPTPPTADSVGGNTAQLSPSGGSTTSSTFLVDNLGATPLRMTGGVRQLDGRANQYGFETCGGTEMMMTKGPAFTFEVRDVPDTLRVDLQGYNAILVTPAKDFYCLLMGEVKIDEGWPPGEYKVYYMTGRRAPRTPDDGLKATLVFTNLAAVAANAQNTMPHVAFDGTANPLITDVFPTEASAVLGSDVNLVGCSPKKVVPVAKVNVPILSKYFVSIHRTSLYAQSASGECKQLGRKGVELEPGEYMLWAEVNPRAPVWPKASLSLYDAEAPLKLPDAPLFEASNKTNQYITVQHSPLLDYSGGFGCKRMTAKPAFYVRTTSKTLFARVFGPRFYKGKDLAFVGPLDPGATPKTCLDSHAARKKPGLYAVYLTTEDAPESAPSVIRIGEQDDDPLVAIGDIPSALALKDREVGRYFPNYFEDFGFKRQQKLYTFDMVHRFFDDKHQVPIAALFHRAPKQLFVFAKSSRRGFLAEEPLLLKKYDAKTSLVYGLDGKPREIRTANLTTDVPSTITIPNPPKLDVPERIEDAFNQVTFVELPIIKKIERVEEKYSKCFHRYMERNDPTYHGSYDLVSLKTGVVVSDKWAARAERKCKLSKMEKKRDKLRKQITTSRNRQFATAEKTVRTRLQ